MKSAFLFLTGLILASCAFFPFDEHSYDGSGNPATKRGVSAFESSNYPLSLKLLTPPAEKGDIDAQYLVGMIHLYGLAGQKNSYLAQGWLTLAAEAGHTAAQEQLAFLYQDRHQPLYNPIDAYHWFKIVVTSKPEYQSELQNLEWTLRSRGLLATADTMPAPKSPYYKGVDYNALFPLR